jgi:PUA domain protein
MFKTLKPEDFGNQSAAKSSVVRGIRGSILEQFPRLENVIDEIIPKKDPLLVVKGKGDFAFFTFAIAGNQVLFFQTKDGPWLPSLRVLHKYPSMMPKMHVDKGAIKFVLRGANVMAPGLTSAGGAFEEGIEKGQAVQITAEGSEHACAIGFMSISSEELKQKPTGQAIEAVHSLGDGLWKLEKVVKE